MRNDGTAEIVYVVTVIGRTQPISGLPSAFFLVNVFSENENFLIFRKFSPFFDIRIIKLATSRPRPFLGHHL